MSLKIKYEDLENLKILIQKSKNTLVFLSEEISHISGVPNYKMPHGLVDSPWQGIDNSRLLSFDFLLAHPQIFYSWSKEVWYDLDKYKENQVHKLIAELQKESLITKVYTESIDMLCQKAIIQDVVEINGNPSAFCLKCGKYFSYDKVSKFVHQNEVPYCDMCGTLLKSQVRLDEQVISKQELLKWKSDFIRCNLCILFGTPSSRDEIISLFNLLDFEKLIVISDKATPFDSKSYLKFNNIDKVVSFLEDSFI
ncbi:MAG: hypothetical protein OWP43_02825 [Sphaerochaetaceae bacterium]|nr:hypothetical protein [Sphaerochaetaceae bacterium]